ncbi:MAG: hypothetical protein VB878_20600 [Pirellulaceae bacterium]
MNVWFGKVAVLVSLLGFIFIRWPHGNRMGSVRIQMIARAGWKSDC